MVVKRGHRTKRAGSSLYVSSWRFVDPPADHIVSTMLEEQGCGRARSVVELGSSSEQLASKPASKPASSHYVFVGGGLLPVADERGAIFS